MYAREAREVLEGAKSASELGHARLAALGGVNACVRASDAICVAERGEYAQGEDHGQALSLLEQVPGGSALATKLRLALGYKSDWSYGVTAVSGPELVKVLRAAEALVVEAERRS